MLPGGCHCGRVRFEVDIETFDAIDCNCSICTKKGFLHVIVTQSAFRLLQGEGELTEYRFNTGIARHLFCKTCGMHAFYIPRSHPDRIDVNARCLDEGIARFRVVPFDGADWEENVHTIR
jgi:hypothetical protein